MYQIADILSAFSTLIGCRNSEDPTVERLPAFLRTTTSGLYLNDGHPLVTVENIKSNARVISISSYSDYDVGTTYYAGDYAKEGGKLYRALKEAKGESTSDESAWQETTPLGEEIRKIINTSITLMISDIINAKQMNANARTLVDSRYLFHGSGRLADTIDNAGKLVGFEISIPRITDLKLEINKIGLQFTDPQTNLNIYIFHSSQSSPIHTFTVSTTKGRSFEWATITEKVLKYISTYDTGTFYIAYYQSDITGNAIRKIRDWSQSPCSNCGRADIESFNLYSKYIKVHPFRVSSNNLEAGYNGNTGDFDSERKIWDIEKNEYTNQTNYGLNLQISLKCDLTDFLVQHKDMFGDLLQRKATIVALEKLAYKPDHSLNRSEELIDPRMVQYILTGEHGTTGLKGEYQKALKNMELNMSGFDPVCMPCKKKGVRFKSVM